MGSHLFIGDGGWITVCGFFEVAVNFIFPYLSPRVKLMKLFLLKASDFKLFKNV
jgi:hypothetical protein